MQLINRETNKCIKDDAIGFWYTNCDSTNDSQHWIIQYMPKYAPIRYFALINKVTGCCMEMPLTNASNDPGGNPYSESPDDTNFRCGPCFSDTYFQGDELWEMHLTDSGYFRLTNYNIGSGVCVYQSDQDKLGGSARTRFGYSICGSYLDQEWTWSRITDAPTMSPTVEPTTVPSETPTADPTYNPSINPTTLYPTFNPNSIQKTIESSSEPPLDGGIDSIETSTTKDVISVTPSKAETATFTAIDLVVAIIITALIVIIISIFVYCIMHRRKQKKNDEENRIDNSTNSNGNNKMNANKAAEMVRIGSVSSTKTGGSIIEKTAVDMAMVGSVSDEIHSAHNHDNGRNDEIDDIRNNDKNLGEDAIADDLVEELNQTAGEDFEVNATIEDPNVETTGALDNDNVVQMNKTHGNLQPDLNLTIDEKIDTMGFVQ